MKIFRTKASYSYSIVLKPRELELHPEGGGALKVSDLPLNSSFTRKLQKSRVFAALLVMHTLQKQQTPKI